MYNVLLFYYLLMKNGVIKRNNYCFAPKSLQIVAWHTNQRFVKHPNQRFIMRAI